VQRECDMLLAFHDVDQTDLRQSQRLQAADRYGR
jgi:hypothetical protein